jgi:CelD/BcsL family acetyltransferase involved in cellulose biosynthesis
VTTGRGLPVYTVDPLSDPRWAELVSRHPAATVFHTPAWLEALQATYGYRATVFTTCPPHNDLTNGLVICRVRSWLTGRRMVSVPFADHCDLLLDASGDGAALIQATHAAAKAEDSALQLRPATSLSQIESELTPSGTYRLHRLDLAGSVPELFARTHRSTFQRRIRHASREDLRCDAGRSDELLAAFYRLVILTRRRHGVPPQPIGWFRRLIASFGEDAEIRVAFHADRAVGGIITLRHRDTLVYKYGASDAAFHHLGVMPLLFWKAIQEAKALGIRTLDLGRSDLNNPGLIKFKDRLGAASTTLTYFRYSPSMHRHRQWPRRIAISMVGRLPDPLFTAAGRLLYRHMG